MANAMKKTLDSIMKAITTAGGMSAIVVKRRELTPPLTGPVPAEEIAGVKAVLALPFPATEVWDSEGAYREAHEYNGRQFDPKAEMVRFHQRKKAIVKLDTVSKLPLVVWTTWRLPDGTPRTNVSFHPDSVKARADKAEAIDESVLA